MTNRIFTRSNSNFANRSSDLIPKLNSEQPFNFAVKRQLAFSAELETQLLELEQHFVSNLRALPSAQQRLSSAAVAIVSDDNACGPCTYDDFGLVEGIDLDVHWM